MIDVSQLVIQKDKSVIGVFADVVVVGWLRLKLIPGLPSFSMKNMLTSALFLMDGYFMPKLT